MEDRVQALADEAMSLSCESRARLVDLLVESLDADELGPIDLVWAREARRRRDEIRNGQVSTVSGEDALGQVRDALDS